MPVLLLAGSPNWSTGAEVSLPGNNTGKVKSVNSQTLRRALLAGLISSCWYVAMNIAFPLADADYNAASQTISELSAIGAKTRAAWIALGLAYSVLVIVFGWAVLRAGDADRRARFAGAALILHGILSLYWPPMHLRGAPFGTTDALHIAWSILTLLLMLVTIVLGAAALSKRFQLYSAITVCIFLAFGTLTAMDAPKIALNEPTPLIGVWERINVATYMAWIASFSVILYLRKGKSPAAS
jgi:hypothetical protein